MWNRIKTLIIKEILAIWRDKKSRTVLIVPPIIQLILFSHAATLEVKNISLAILNYDQGKPSFELVQRFRGSPNFNNIYNINNEMQLKTLIVAQRVNLVMKIDDDFSRKVESGKPANVQFIMDGRRSNVSQISLGYATQIVNQYNADENKNIFTKTPNTKIEQRNWFNPNLDYIKYNVPCLIGILTTVIGITVTALSVAREREFGTFEQLLVSPLSSREIIIGKTIPPLIIGMIEGTIILSVAVILFNIPFVGNLLYLYIGMFVYLLSVIGLGLFISSISMTQQQAILGAFIFTVPAILISGYATPVENMPQWMQNLSLIDPLRHFIVIIKGVYIKDMPFYMVVDSIWPLITIAAFTLTTSGWFFRRRLE